MSDTSRPEYPQSPQQPPQPAEQPAFRPYGEPAVEQPQHSQQPPYSQQPQFSQQPQGSHPYIQTPAYTQTQTPTYTTSPYINPEPQPTGMSITGLVLGIISILGGAFFLIPQIVGVIFSHIGLSREPAGRGMAIAGLVLNYLCLLGFLALVLFIIVIGASLDDMHYDTPVPTYIPSPDPTVSGPVT